MLRGLLPWPVALPRGQGYRRKMRGERRYRRRGSGAGTGRRIGGGGRENAEQKKGCDFPHVDHAAASDCGAFRLATAAATLPANERRSVMPSVKSVGPSTRRGIESGDALCAIKTETNFRELRFYRKSRRREVSLSRGKNSLWSSSGVIAN
jgi:hypothetical protein